MSANSLRLSNGGKRSQGHVVVEIVAGGGGQGVARQRQVSDADVVIYIDNEKDVKSVPAQVGLVTFILAKDHTVGTLTANQNLPQETQEHLADHPIPSLAAGLGAARFIGALATLELLDKAEFDRDLKTQVLDPVRVRHNGVIQHVTIRKIYSGSGATGSASASKVAESVAALFREHFQPIIELESIVVGSFTYATVGANVDRNLAATLHELRLRLAAPCHDAKTVQTGIFLELPMVGGARAERDAFVAQAYLALMAPEVRDQMDLTASNDALSSRQGNITLAQLSFGHSFQSHEILSDLASSTIGEVQRLSSCPPKGEQVLGVQVLSRMVEAGPPIDDLTAAARCSIRTGLPPEFLKACLKEGKRPAGIKVVANLLDSGPLDLNHDIGKKFGVPGQTAGQFIQKFGTLRALEGFLEAEHQARQQQLDGLTQSHVRAKLDLQKGIGFLAPRSLLEKCQATLAKPSQRLAAFRRSLIQWRELEEERLRLTHEIAALTTARESVRTEITAERRRLQRVVDCLALYTTSTRHSRKPRIEVKPLDDMLPQLLRATAAGPDDGALEKVLGGCVQCVTRDGLAQLVGASDASVAAIAERIAYGAWPTEAPYWGGQPFRTPGQFIVVVPPLTGQLPDEIRAVLRSLGSKKLLAVAQSCEASVNVVQLEIHKPQFENEIETKYIRHNLEEVNKRPGLYLIEGLFEAAARTNGMKV